MTLLLMAWLQMACTPAGKQHYLVYSYHSDPPFYLPDQPQDLSRAWVEDFNQWQDDIQLELVHIQRADLNSLVESGKPYLILWANPLWFSFRDPKLQASHRIFWDADIVVSHQRRPVHYEAPRDLTGLRLGGRQGFFYHNLNELVAARQLTRVDVQQDFDNYRNLLDGRIDAFIMTRASLLYWREHQLADGELFVAATPHDAYSRHILASQDRSGLLELINQFIDHSTRDPAWLAQLEYWGVERLLDPFELELDELMELNTAGQGGHL